MIGSGAEEREREKGSNECLGDETSRKIGRGRIEEEGRFVDDFSRRRSRVSLRAISSNLVYL